MKSHRVPYLGAFVVVTALASSVRGVEIIPEGFPVEDLSQYTVRYLSEEGNDTDSCLSNQAYPPLDNTTKYCGSLIYTLTRGYQYETKDVTDLIILILPGSYLIGDEGIKIVRYHNIFLSKMPDTFGEVVLKCKKFLEDGFNNLHVVFAVNFSLYGIVFTAVSYTHLTLPTIYSV